MATRDRRLGAFVLGGLLVALLLAGVVSSFASAEPDGLERVAIDEGFAGTATDHPLGDGPVADYAVTGVEDESLSTGVAGVLGVGLTFAIAAGATLAIRKVRRRAPATTAT
jgi:hypothetical protein